MIQEKLCVFIPGEPVPMARARIARGGRGVFTPPKQRKAKLDVQKLLKTLKLEMLDAPLHVELDFYFTRAKSNKSAFVTKRPDLDNLVKLILDAANELVWRDDSIIVSLACSKQYATEQGPGVRFKVCVIE